MASVRKIESPPALIPTKKRVAAYARVSSGKDAMLHSLSAQVSYYSAYIQQRPDWEYAGVYADEGFTGTGETRPEFRRLLDDCRTGKVDMVITKSISRFARNTVTLLETTRELKDLGVRVLFERESLYSDSPDGEMVLTLLAAVAQAESKAVSDNCKWRYRSRFKNGEPANWRFLYGYRIDKSGIRIDPEQAAVVRLIYARYLEGWGFTRIIKELESQSIPGYFGGRWRTMQISNILRNEKYTGNALLQKRFVADHLTKKEVRNNGELAQYFVENTHEAIIGIDIFRRAQELLAERKATYSAPDTVKVYNVFSGLLRCVLCGGTYHRRTANASSPYARPAWICSTFKTRGKEACASKQIPEDILMQVTADVLGLVSFDEAVFKKRVASISVHPKNKLVFHLLDCRALETQWAGHSRKRVQAAQHSG